MSFEQDLVKLESLINKLESNDTGLEEGIKLYEQGIALTKNCLEGLESHKGKIVVLQKEMNKLIENNFTPDEE